MRIAIWVLPDTWQSCVDAAADVAGPDDELRLIHVTDSGIAELAHGSFEALVGRGAGGPDPGDAVAREAARAAGTLLDAAEARLGRTCTRDLRAGRPEREVTRAAADVGLLILARDGDHSSLGPRSLGPPTRFVVDHAPCRVLLVWPDEPPGLATMPAEPPHPPGHRAPPPPPPGHHGPPPPPH